MKNNQGITLIALSITIIVLFIIASVSTYSGINALRESKEEKQKSELYIVQQAIVETYTKYKMTGNIDYLKGEKIDASSVASSMDVALKISSPSSENPEECYYQLNAESLKQLGITQTEDVYVVNYSTGEVLNTTLKQTKSGEKLYIYAIDNIN